MIPPAAANLLVVTDEMRFADAAAALIRIDDGRYLMQLRDDKPGVFYPGHWGLFGGEIEPGEDPETALRRELTEELSYRFGELRYFTRLEFDFSAFGFGICQRLIYETDLPAAAFGQLVLGEGERMEAIPLPEILLERRVTPYDSFALWLRHAADRRGTFTSPITFDAR